MEKRDLTELLGYQDAHWVLYALPEKIEYDCGYANQFVGVCEGAGMREYLFHGEDHREGWAGPILVVTHQASHMWHVEKGINQVRLVTLDYTELVQSFHDSYVFYSRRLSRRSLFTELD